MPITVKEAIDQIATKIEQKGKFSFGNLLDSAIGVVTDNSIELQNMLNKLMAKQGVLSAEDEKELQELFEKQQEEKRKRQRIRTKNFLFGAGIVMATGTIIYFALKNKK